MKMNRRDLLSAAGGGWVLSCCSGATTALAMKTPATKEEESEVTAVEDLMREHGVLRRALFVYSESAKRLRIIPVAIPLGAQQPSFLIFLSPSMSEDDR
jgi:hypothetical protein